MNHSTKNNNNFIYTPNFLIEFIARIHSLLRQTAAPVCNSSRRRSSSNSNSTVWQVADEPFQFICNGKFLSLCKFMARSARAMCVYTGKFFGGVI